MTVFDFLVVLILAGVFVAVMELLLHLAAPYNTLVRIVVGILVFICFLSLVGVVGPINLGLHMPRVR